MDGSIDPENGDVVLKTPEKEFLRLKKDGSFVALGKTGANDAQIVAALRWWLAGTGAWGKGHTFRNDTACHKCAESDPGMYASGAVCRWAEPSSSASTAVQAKPEASTTSVVLSVAPSTALASTQPPIQLRAKSALEALRATIKERDDTRTKAVGALAELLATFQRVMRPFVIELGQTAKMLGQERPSSIFDAGNTFSIDGIFGMEWTGGEYVLYQNGNRRTAGVGEVASYIVEHHVKIDLDVAVNKIVSGLEAARDNVMNGLGAFEKIRADSTSISKRIKSEEQALKALEGPKP